MKVLRISKASRESRNDRPSFVESASPFIDEGDGFTRESVRERECVGYLVLLPTPSGTRWFVSAHSTVDA